MKKSIYKKDMVRLYCDQLPEKLIIDEIQALQEQNGFKRRCRLVSNKVKEAFVQRFGQPSDTQL